MLGKVGGRRRRLRYALKRTVKKQSYKLSIINKHLFSYLKDKKKERNEKANHRLVTVLTKHVFGRGLISRIHKELLQLKISQTINFFLNKRNI